MTIRLNFPNPVEDRSHLFDRTAELERIQETLDSSARRPIVIMGERVTGKTSLMRVASAQAVASEEIVVLNLPAIHTRDELVGEFLEGLAGELGQSLYRLGYRDSDGRLLIATISESVRVAHGLITQQRGKRFLLCIDELDSMLLRCEGETAEQILDLIRYLIEQTSLPIKLLCTMTRKVPPILHSVISPFTNIARVVELCPWTHEQARPFAEWLLKGRFVLSDVGHTALFNAGGGHPYFTKAILYSLMGKQAHLPHGATLGVQEIAAATAASVTLGEVDFTVRNIVQEHFSEPEVRILRESAEQETGIARDEIADLGDRYVQAAEALTHRHYLRRTADGGYRHAYGLLGRWIALSSPILMSGRPGTTFPPTRPMPSNGQIPLLLVDAHRRRLFVGQQELNLAPMQYSFLCLLGEELTSGVVVSKDRIADTLWEDQRFEGIPDYLIDSLVSRTRKALGEHGALYIETRIGLGYSLNQEHVRYIAAKG